MNVLDANRTELGYELRSELARSLLHATERDPNRTLAWVNSICLLFLLIGVAGSKPAAVSVKPLPALEDATAAIVEPLPPPPQALPEQSSFTQGLTQQSSTGTLTKAKEAFCWKAQVWVT